MANRLNWQVITEDADVDHYNVYRSIVGVESANDAPFPLVDGMTLEFQIDGGSTQAMTIYSGDFVDIDNATAQEVCDAIVNNISGVATHPGASDSVYVRSSSSLDPDDNTASAVKVVGGTANAVLGFPLLTYTEQSHFVKIAEVPYTERVIEYIDEDGRVYDWYRVSAVDNVGIESAKTQAKQAGSGRNPVCLVYGHIQDARGYPICDKEVKATVEYPPTVDGVTTAWVDRDPVTTLSLRDGTFEIELLQNASYEINIPSIEFSRIVKIPATAQANLFDLEFEEKDLDSGGEEYNF